MSFVQIGAVLSRVKTPLTLAGLAVIVLYLLYSQVLELDIFSTLGEDATSGLLTRLIDYVFYLAIVAVVLGVWGFLAQRSKPDDDTNPGE